MSKFASVMTIAASLAISQVEAFWGTGHLLVARYAQTILEKENPAAFANALSELKSLTNTHSSLTKAESSHPFTECATFADDIKSTYSFQNGWHFINQPYLDQGGSLSDFTFTQPAYDVVGALENLTNWISDNGTAYKSSYYYTQISKNFPSDSDGRSFALRLIIHYVGDLHQPLHAVAEVDSKYPSGDQGGNFESLPSICGAGNLHAVWDSVAYNYCGYPVLPLTSADWSWYTSESAAISTAYPIDLSKTRSLDFNGWAAESLELAQSTVYPGVVVGQALSDSYVSKANNAIRERMMFGARRLADLIVQVYGSRAELFLQ